MKQIVTLCVFLLTSTLLYAQQDVQFSHNMFNQMAQNPGFAGTSGDICITAIQRNQWVGFTGAPKTTLLTINTAFNPFKIPSGIGLTLVNDIIGAETNFNGKLAYSYRKRVWSGELGLGIDFGIMNKKLKTDKDWVFPDAAPTSGEVITKDGTYMVFDLGLGAFYHNNDYYIGLSTSHVNQPDVNYPLAEGQQGKAMSTFLKRHYFLATGYNYQLPVPLFELLPSVYIKSDGSSSQIDVNANILYNKKIWGGVSYRFTDGVVFMLGLEMKSGLKLGYAYDLTTSAIRKSGSGSHEIMLSYSFDFSLEKNPQRYKSVRFL